jgi:hypothetical protein
MIVVLLIVGAVVYRVVHQGILPPIAVPDDEDEEHQGHVADRAPMTQTTATEHRKETA